VAGQILHHQPGGDLAGQQHARNARAGVGSRAGEVEAGHVFRPVVRPEVRRLPQQRLQREGRPPLRTQQVTEVQRRPLVLDHDSLTQPVQSQAVLQGVQNALPQAWRLGGPVDAAV
jgi:hypothetical protein